MDIYRPPALWQPSQTPTIPRLLNMPAELFDMVVNYTDYPTKLSLSATSRCFHALLRNRTTPPGPEPSFRPSFCPEPVRDDRLVFLARAELLPQNHLPRLLACSICLRLRPHALFADRLHDESLDERVCFPCGAWLAACSPPSDDGSPPILPLPVGAPVTAGRFTYYLCGACFQWATHQHSLWETRPGTATPEFQPCFTALARVPKAIDFDAMEARRMRRRAGRAAPKAALERLPREVYAVLRAHLDYPARMRLARTSSAMYAAARPLEGSLGEKTAFLRRRELALPRVAASDSLWGCYECFRLRRRRHFLFWLERVSWWKRECHKCRHRESPLVVQAGYIPARMRLWCEACEVVFPNVGARRCPNAPGCGYGKPSKRTRVEVVEVSDDE